MHIHVYMCIHTQAPAYTGRELALAVGAPDELTPEHGGLYGPPVDGPEQFNQPTTSQAFQDYFVAKLADLRRYEPDLIYFDAKWAAVRAVFFCPAARRPRFRELIITQPVLSA